VILHDVFAFVVLGSAIWQLAVLPNVERAVLAFFIPPILALLFLVTNTGRFNPTVIRGCRLFLSMIVVSVLLGEQRFVLANLKPQFPGMPAQADRILVFYFVAYGLFLWVICPGYVLGSWLRQHWSGSPTGKSSWIMYAGCFFWVGTMGVLGTALVTHHNKFF
jgi:hypothetical protein